jgi:hypothetical protein
MKLTLTALSFALLPLAAQEATAPPAPKTNTGTALVIKTADPDIAEDMADTFTFTDKLPDLKNGEHFVMTVGGDGKLTVTTGGGMTEYLQIRAKPALLAEAFADKIDEVEQQATMIAGMAAGRIGATPNELTALVKEVFAFPKQLDAINVDVEGSPKSSMSGKVDVVPAASGWFAKFVSELAANKLGAPALRDPDGLFQLSANLDQAALLKAMQPFLGFVVGAAANDKETKAKYTAMMGEMAKLLDGTLAMSMSEGKGQKMLLGLLDAARANEMLEGAEYKAWRQATADANPMADVEFKDNALTHRGITCNKQTTEVSVPTGGDSTTSQFTCIAEQFLLGAGSEEDAKSLIDAVLDQKVVRAALANNALLTVTAKVAELVRTMSNGMADGEDAPRQLDVAMTKQGNGLNFAFKVDV